MSKCHFLSSYCVVSKVRHRTGATRTRGKFGRPKSENTVYMLEASSLRYNRAEQRGDSLHSWKPYCLFWCTNQIKLHNVYSIWNACVNNTL